ncbi:MAG: glutamine amidotransferase [Myxococcota bacterium]|jgi:glutamine amidotransferase
MCRLFGFRSVIPSQVHASLASAENALGVQSQNHPDGWGVAYYVAGAPHVIKSADPAYDDRLFRRVSGVVSSETVIAHVRKATRGEKTLLNSHPFQHGRWIMAHNGDIDGFAEVRDDLRAIISPKLRRYILGDTDSEVVFYLFLTYLSHAEDLHRSGASIDHVADSLRRAINTVAELSESKGLKRPMLTICITDGTLLVASRFGKELHRSTYKQSCPEREICPSHAFECENPSRNGYVSHFILSSEPLQGQNVWDALNEGDMVGCDWRMKTHSWSI